VTAGARSKRPGGLKAAPTSGGRTVFRNPTKIRDVPSVNRSDETTTLTRDDGRSRVDETRAGWVRETLDRFEGDLLLYSARILRDAHGAEDVVQEAFLRLCREDPARVGPRLPGWMFRVCRNLALDRLRRETVMERTNASPMDGRAGGGVDPAHRAVVHDEVLAVLHTVETLPERQQEAVRLRFQHGLSYRDISGVMDVTVNHVGVLLHEALKTLRARRRAPANPGAPLFAMRGAAR